MKNRGRFGVLLLAGLISLSAVGIAFFSTKFESKEEARGAVVVSDTAESNNSRSSNLSANISEADEDGDGVPTWKEVLVGTDPKNPDTDGDGISDGAEDAEGASAFEEEGASYAAPRALSSTDALARELFATYAKARSDGTFDEGEIERGISDIIERNVAQSDQLKRYTKHDLSVEADVNVAAYESAVSGTFREALDVREYELNVFARAVSSNSNAELQKLLVTAAIYEHIRDNLLALDVPEKAAEEHLRTVNELSSVASAVRGLGGWSGDPLDALTLVNAFSEKEKRFAAAVSELYALIPVLKKQGS